MKKEMYIFRNKSRTILIVAFIALATFLAWAWKGVQDTVLKGLSDSRNIRISKINECSLVAEKGGLEKPHFSGWNSIL